MHLLRPVCLRMRLCVSGLAGKGVEMGFKECSDETLIELYRAGEQPAIEVIFERYKNLVRKKAKAMYLAGGDNDDLIQEGMIGLYKAVRDFESGREASFATFASMCINRQMITAVTASNRKKNTPLNTYVSFDQPANSDEDNDMKLVDVLQTETEQDPEKLFIDKEHTAMLEKKLLSMLSRFERQVIELYMDGKDYQQIAEILGKSSKSIDNALQRIRAKAGQLS